MLRFNRFANRPEKDSATEPPNATETATTETNFDDFGMDAYPPMGFEDDFYNETPNLNDDGLATQNFGASIEGEQTFETAGKETQDSSNKPPTAGRLGLFAQGMPTNNRTRSVTWDSELAKDAAPTRKSFSALTGSAVPSMLDKTKNLHGTAAPPGTAPTLSDKRANPTSESNHTEETESPTPETPKTFNTNAMPAPMSVSTGPRRGSIGTGMFAGRGLFNMTAAGATPKTAFPKAAAAGPLAFAKSSGSTTTPMGNATTASRMQGAPSGPFRLGAETTAAENTTPRGSHTMTRNPTPTVVTPGDGLGGLGLRATATKHVEFTVETDDAAKAPFEETRPAQMNDPIHPFAGNESFDDDDDEEKDDEDAVGGSDAFKSPPFASPPGMLDPETLAGTNIVDFELMGQEWTQLLRGGNDMIAEYVQDVVDGLVIAESGLGELRLLESEMLDMVLEEEALLLELEAALAEAAGGDHHRHDE